MIEGSKVASEVWDRDAPRLVQYLCELIERHRVRNILKDGRCSVTPHYWYKSLRRVTLWQKTGSDIRSVGSDIELLRFVTAAKQVKVFEPEWRHDSQQETFLQRLRASKDVPSLLFELQTGVHFLRQGLNVHYLGCEPSEDKTSDLIVQSGEERALVECTCRVPSKARERSDKQMTDDLLRSAKDKLESLRDYGAPRLVAIKVPEKVFWDSPDIRLRIQERISQWVKEDRLLSTNCVYFLGSAEAEFVRRARPGSVGYWLLSPRVFLFHNSAACRYALPPSFVSKLTRRIH